MSDLVARFRAEADSDAAFEAAMRLVRETTEEIARLQQAMAEMQDDLDAAHRALGLAPYPLTA